MIELNKRQYEILTFMANTGELIYHWSNDEELWALVNAGLCQRVIFTHTIKITPHAREMFRDAGLRRVQ
jgi:hypothetical protein